MHADYRTTKIFLLCPTYYKYFIFNYVDPIQDKEKLFENAKGLLPDAVESDSMGDRSSTYENKIPINSIVTANSIFCFAFDLQHFPVEVHNREGTARENI